MVIHLWNRAVALGAVLVLSCGVIGCTSQTEEFKSFDELETESAGHDHDHGHEHGPNDGEVFEIGDHEYHGEVVIDDDTHELKIFVLDHDLEGPVEVAADSVTLTLPAAEGAEAKTINLEAASSGAATASSFAAADDELIHEILEAGKVTGTLRLMIDEKEYVVELDLPVHGEPHDHSDDTAEPEADAEAGAEADAEAATENGTE